MDTKGERREAKRAKRRYGLVKHNPPNVRPVKLKAPKVTVKDGSD